MVKKRYLMGGDIEKLLLWYKFPRKKWKNIERKKNWLQSVKWDPPYYENVPTKTRRSFKISRALIFPWMILHVVDTKQTSTRVYSTPLMTCQRKN